MGVFPRKSDRSATETPLLLRFSPRIRHCFWQTISAWGKTLPDDETTANMYRLATEKLTCVGYQHYEISNYALSGYQCRHNRVYWQNRPYYGFGMGAASYTHNQRFTRPRKRPEYYEWVTGGGLIDISETSRTDTLLETLMLGLRLAEGVSLTAISEQFGLQVKKEILEALQPYIQQEWVIISPDSRVQLTDPEGFLFSNTVLTALFQRFE